LREEKMNGIITRAKAKWQVEGRGIPGFSII
jgi:hypothetical protein